ncbi:hypothetical protein SDC9_179439 [bioreactor metagenome]|uniref:Uncharacterized protein n=1 Tax=bioreactor metagenome TaxID=1076179 RepID=A0A645H6R3_9ZZZZ
MLKVAVEFIRDGIARAAGAGTLGVAALNHKVINDAMKNHAVVKTFIGKVDEVLGRYWRFILK